MIRIGSGHDSHRLTPGRPLVLGGVRIEHPKGLDGHSDADAVMHALTDALLGALALGDIGEMFPDSDAKYHNADSSIFLAEAVKRVREHGYALGNADITIFAEEPKLGPHKKIIAANLARLCGVNDSVISVKAKTGEKVGHVGRGEAIGCHAVVLLHKIGS